MHSITVVTAIFSNGADSVEGGRGRNFLFYLPTLAALSGIHTALVVYTEPENVALTKKYLSFWFKKLKIIPTVLKDYIYYNEVIKWKYNDVNPKFNSYNDRNEILCFSKIEWLTQTAFNNPFECDFFYWIDAGLFHHGLFPESAGGMELNIGFEENRLYPQSKTTLLNPGLGEALYHWAESGKKMCFIAHPSELKEHSIENLITMKYPHIKNRQYRSHLVGGLFGGDKNNLSILHHRFRNMLLMFLERKVYGYEEQIFSAINIVYPELFNLRFFDEWSFYAPGEPNSFLAEDGNSFYKVFKKLISEFTPL